MESHTIPELWKLACEFDKIPEDTKFAVFSDNNYWAKQHDRAVELFFRYKLAERQMIGG